MYFACLSHTEYPELQRIKRELALLSKLYSLYNSVIDSINGYYDIQWSDLDTEKINSELLDFQNRYASSKHFPLIYVICL